MDPLTFFELPGERTCRSNANGGVAQLVAHLHGMQRVRGSSPLTSTDGSHPWARDAARFCLAAIVIRWC